MTIILSTGNSSKARQVKAIFNDPVFTILTLKEAGIEGEAVEDGLTLEENAFKKAAYALSYSDGNCWTMADDTGIFINALNGEPGIKAARWAGEHAGTAEILQFTLDKMDGIEDRSAYFETAVVLLAPDGSSSTYTGKINGTMETLPQAPPQPQMPYTSLFRPDGSEKVLAQMTVIEENALSNRGKAFRQVLDFLKTKL